ncbi:MAG: response regulator [Candidatus Omnitrophica bacterium]|nr:response regulator [Candidatus Omnitrophota bacterium]
MAEKILIVDDDLEFREELRDFLHEYEVIEASSGMEAINILKRANEIGLVLMDVMMPGAAGTDVLKEIKKTDPDLNIIILTGHSSKEVAIEALEGKADGYIEKPLDLKKLKETVERIMDKKISGVDAGATDISSKIKKVKLFVERNCFKKIGLNEAAQAVCLSPKYLSRIFKEHCRSSFSQFRLKIKIEESKKLLEKTGYNINQISDKLGYENAESFIRQFKRFVKATPTEYRKKIQKYKKLKSRK